jgi:hypothetical protein
VLGGYGYTREFDVEQLYRDNRLNAIHEGTHGIQGLDLLGRKVVMAEGAGLRALLDAMGGTIERATAIGGETAQLATALGVPVRRIGDVTVALWSSADVESALANSSVYLEAVGHVVVAWMWLEQWLAASGREGHFYEGKRHAARYFFRFELPKTAPAFDLLASLDRTTLDMRDEWFAPAGD